MASPAAQETKTLHASCHCKIHEYAFTIPTTSLPLRASHCHCDMCRQTNGAAFESYVSIPLHLSPYSASSPPPSTLSYFSPTPATKRYFCNLCGTHLFSFVVDGGTWPMNTGALDTAEPDLVKYDSHIYVAEGPQQDGFCLFDILDDGLPRYAGDDEGNSPLSVEEVDSLVKLARPSTENDVDVGKKLEVGCYCGRVKGLLSRPLAVPENKWVAWYATPDKKKWVCSHCACTSCRKSSGSVVLSFIFPSGDHLEWLPSSEPGQGHTGGVAKAVANDWRTKAGIDWWISSKGILRGWCGGCGACVLYRSAEREGVEIKDDGWTGWATGEDANVDLPVGILKTSNKDGERLAEWTQFDGKIDFEEDLDGYDATLTKSFVKGVKKYVEHQQKT